MIRRLLVIALAAGAGVVAPHNANPAADPADGASANPVQIGPGVQPKPIEYEICYCKTWGKTSSTASHRDPVETVRQAITLAAAPPASRPELQKAVADDTEFLTDFLRRWVGPVELLGVGTRKIDTEDIIFAHWKRTSTPQDIYLREGAVTNDIVIPLPDGAAKEPETFQAFLESIFGSQRGMIEAVHFKLWQTPPNTEILGEGTGVIVGPQFYAPGYGSLSMTLVRLSSGEYLLLNAGKRLVGHYPESAITVAERFPAFAEQIKSWDRTKIIKELGQYSAGSPNTAFRDVELLNELVRRGLQGDELRALLGLKEPAKQFQWLGSPRCAAATLTTLVKAGQTNRYRAIIREAIVQRDSARLGGTDTSQAALAVLARDNGVDFVPEVLSLLESQPLSIKFAPGKWQSPGFDRSLIRYLGARADSDEVANRLLMVPIADPEDAGFRDLAVTEIRHRACQKRGPEAHCK